MPPTPPTPPLISTRGRSQVLKLKREFLAFPRQVGWDRESGSSGGGSRGQRAPRQGITSGANGRRNRNGRNRQQEPAGSKFNEARRGGGATRVQAQPVQQRRMQQQEPQWNTNEVPPQAQMYPDNMQREVDQEILLEKEQEVQELRETIDVRARCFSS